MNGQPDYPYLIAVQGIPAPQGSKAFKGISPVTGRAIMVESSKKVKSWRPAVAATFQTVYPRYVALDGPLVARMVFTLARPANKPGSRVDAADRYPDVSKLARSTEDALTGLAWTDDARIIGYDRLWKTYPGRDREALPVPGAIIAVRRATHEEIDLDPGSRAGASYSDLIDAWQEEGQP